MERRGPSLVLAGGRFAIHADELHIPEDVSYGENDPSIRVFILSYLKVLDDTPLRCNGYKPLKFYFQLLKDLCRTHVSDTIKRYSSLCTDFMNMSSCSESGYKALFVRFAKTPIFREFHEFVKTGKPELGQFILTFLLYGKKLEYDDPEFEAAALRGWLQVEEELSNAEFSDDDTTMLKRIVASLLGPFDDDLFLGKFGPGKVAEKEVKDVVDKYVHLGLPPYLRYVLRDGRFGLTRVPAIQPRSGWIQGLADSRSLKTQRRAERHARSGRVKRARKAVVKKDIFTARSICMEPNDVMYVQQGILRWLVRSMDKGRISRFVTLSDQGRSQSAARYGSCHNTMDTIDLSSASDRVHVDLVRRVFPAKILFYLLATRTSIVMMPDGSERHVKKFAPMGSALCFPVQSIIFTAMTIYAALVQDFGHTPLGLSTEAVGEYIDRRFVSHEDATATSSRYKAPVVYGDDICIDSRLTQMVTHLLTKCYLKVNENKSFVGANPFREACGIYCYKGHDVTPLRYRLPIRQSRLDPNWYASVIGAINRARAMGYRNVATFYLGLVRRDFRVPFTTREDLPGVVVSRHHYTASEKMHDAWQCAGRFVDWLVARSGLRDLSHTEYAYEQEMRKFINEGTQEFTPASKIRPQETRIGTVWSRLE